jgi:hypothetical protein
VTETRSGTFEELLEIASPEMRPIARRLHEIVVDVDPNAVEVVRLGDRAATYGLGPRKMKEGYAYIMPHKKWVNLGFYQGVALTDPAGIMEGTGKKLRHVKVRSVTDAGRPEIRALIEAALAERKQTLGHS